MYVLVRCIRSIIAGTLGATVLLRLSFVRWVLLIIMVGRLMFPRWSGCRRIVFLLLMMCLSKVSILFSIPGRLLRLLYVPWVILILLL